MFDIWREKQLHNTYGIVFEFAHYKKHRILYIDLTFASYEIIISIDIPF